MIIKQNAFSKACTTDGYTITWSIVFVLWYVQIISANYGSTLIKHVDKVVQFDGLVQETRN